MDRKSDLVKKLPVWAQIVIIVMTISGMGAGYVWDKIDSKSAQVESRAALEEYIRQGDTLEKIVDRQEDLDELKKCVNAATQVALDEFNNDFITELGNVLAFNNISFPQKLNESIRELRQKFAKVKDCLIDPGIK